MYYIDGYNVIYHCPQLRPLAHKGSEAARDALVDQVSRFCTVTGEQAKIVFDGRGRQSQTDVPWRASPGLEVVYSPGHQSADTMIERFVYGTDNRHEVMVVSGDRGIRDLCRGFGAFVMEPAHFLSLVEEKLEGARALLPPATRDSRYKDTLGDRLDPGDLDRLRELKKKLDE